MPNIQFRCTCCVHTWMSLDFFGVIFFSFFFAFFLFNSTGSALSISPDVLLLQSSSGMSKKDWRVNGLTRRDVFCFCVLLFFSTKKKYGYSRSPSGLQHIYALCRVFLAGLKLLKFRSNFCTLPCCK